MKEIRAFFESRVGALGRRREGGQAAVGRRGDRHRRHPGDQRRARRPASSTRRPARRSTGSGPSSARTAASPGSSATGPPTSTTTTTGPSSPRSASGWPPRATRRRRAAARGLEKLTKYLREHPAPDLHHRTFLLWASLKLDGLMTPEEREKTRRDLRSLQRADGGWSLPTLGDWKRRDGSPNPKDGPSDGYATGLVVYVLRQAGVAPDDPAIRRGVGWLAGQPAGVGAVVHAVAEQRQGPLHRQRGDGVRRDGAGVVPVTLGSVCAIARRTWR